ncbi:hypothetical protein DFH09DRAFT_1275286 [Mycena vulgaris]|nr:hypothetical protein DFH09DRAFT_1275286 [Mycena vulgaris]
MRIMYRRAALAFIQKNRSIPLSEEILEIYSSYFVYKYISPATKIAILKELTYRARYLSSYHDDPFLYTGAIQVARQRDTTCNELVTWPPLDIRICFLPAQRHLCVGFLRQVVVWLVGLLRRVTICRSRILFEDHQVTENLGW